MQTRVIVIVSHFHPFLYLKERLGPDLNSAVLMASTIRLGLPTLANIGLECNSLEVRIQIQWEIPCYAACADVINIFTSAFQFWHNKLKCLSLANCAVAYCAMFQLFHCKVLLQRPGLMHSNFPTFFFLYRLMYCYSPVVSLDILQLHSLWPSKVGLAK